MDDGRAEPSSSLATVRLTLRTNNARATLDKVLALSDEWRLSYGKLREDARLTCVFLSVPCTRGKSAQSTLAPEAKRLFAPLLRKADALARASALAAARGARVFDLDPDSDDAGGVQIEVVRCDARGARKRRRSGASAVAVAAPAAPTDDFWRRVPLCVWAPILARLHTPARLMPVALANHGLHTMVWDNHALMRAFYQRYWRYWHWSGQVVATILTHSDLFPPPLHDHQFRPRTEWDLQGVRCSLLLFALLIMAAATTTTDAQPVLLPGVCPPGGRVQRVREAPLRRVLLAVVQPLPPARARAPAHPHSARVARAVLQRATPGTRWSDARRCDA